MKAAPAPALPTGERASAVVVGLDTVTGLQTARLLADRGIPVTGIASDRTHPFCSTKSCVEVIEVDTSGPDLVTRLVDLGRHLNSRAVLYPCTDLSVRTLSRQRAELGNAFALALPDNATIDMLMDKAAFAEFAQANGLPVPPTVVVRSPADAERAATTLQFPCVVKPPVHDAQWDAHAPTKVVQVMDVDAWWDFYAEAHTWAPTLVIQSWVPGGEDALFSCNLYMDRQSRPLATFVARKLRQWPPDQGTSCLGEEVRNDDVLNTTVALFAAAGFHGLGYVEMKRHARTGELLIIEPNVGRPTGRSAIAEAGGVELLQAMYCDQLRLPLPSNLQQQYGSAKWVYAGRDVQAALHRWRSGELTLRQWAASWRGVRHDAVFRLRDQRPFWGDLLRGAGKRTSRLSRKTRTTTLAPATQATR